MWLVLFGELPAGTSRAITGDVMVSGYTRPILDDSYSIWTPRS